MAVIVAAAFKKKLNNKTKQSETIKSEFLHTGNKYIAGENDGKNFFVDFIFFVKLDSFGVRTVSGFHNGYNCF
jgi:hypothetical protein